MRSLLGRPVFAVGETEYCWEDILLAALVWDLWPGVVERARTGLALLAEADSEEAGEELEVSDEQVEEAANEFRYGQNLIAAEEMEAWLEAWGLDLDGWFQWVLADHLRSRRPDAAAPERPADGEAEPADAEELAAAIHAEAVCSGFLGRLSYQLAERAAVHARSLDTGDGAEHSSGVGNAAGTLPPQAISDFPDLGLPPDEVSRRLAHLAALDAAYSRFRASIVEPAQVAGRIRTRQTEWTRMSVRILRLDTEDAAREALISVRDDGCDLDEVASDAGFEIVDGTYFLEELDAGVRDHLLAARRDELLGPLKEGEKWSLFLVVDKKLPSLDDPEIVARAEKSLLRSALSREVDNRVSWRWRT
jgi:hypothetical protein